MNGHRSRHDTSTALDRGTAARRANHARWHGPIDDGTGDRKSLIRRWSTAPIWLIIWMKTDLEKMSTELLGTGRGG